MEIATLQAIAAVVSTVSSMEAASAQAQQQRIQAQQAELQGRQNALQYNRQAVQVLERQQMLAGAVRARAASGGVDPFTGSPMTIQQADAMKAGEEYGIAKDNATMAIYGGLAQSQSLQAAASATERLGMLNTVVKGAEGYIAYEKVKTPR
jgi:hypothetical protein